jgi:hypothetical protein
MTLEQISAYLPYGVTCKVFEPWQWTLGYHFILSVETCKETRAFNSLKMGYAQPILRPLSDLTLEELQEFDDELYDFPVEIFLDQIAKLRITYEFAQWLLKKHFDIFGLIDAGDAIDINKVTEE